jgi:hypothetical protein
VLYGPVLLSLTVTLMVVVLPTADSDDPQADAGLWLQHLRQQLEQGGWREHLVQVGTIRSAGWQIMVACYQYCLTVSSFGCVIPEATRITWTGCSAWTSSAPTHAGFAKHDLCSCTTHIQCLMYSTAAMQQCRTTSCHVFPGFVPNWSHACY